MNILFTCDENYAPYLATTILSILKTNQDSKITFYILETNFSVESKNCITNLVKKYNQKEVFVNVDEDYLNPFPQVSDYISKTTNVRLLISEILPAEIHKILYLDCDTLVNGSLKSLYATDLKYYALGAVLDPWVCGLPKNDPNYTELNLHRESLQIDEYKYVNAGVLLINLDFWREYDVIRKTMDFLAKTPKPKYMDQDIINFIFKDKIMMLDMRYNFCSSSQVLLLNKTVNYPCTMPVVIFHDTGPIKAWNEDSLSISSIYFNRLFKKISNKPISWLNKVDTIKLSCKIKRLKHKYKLYKTGIY